MAEVRKPVALIVLDGWGIGAEEDHNAIHLARKPCWDMLHERYPWTSLEAHGEAVGLVPGQMGNSNVGHLNLGAGKIVYQDLMRISRSIETGDFFVNEALREVMEAVARDNSGGARMAGLHLMGLLSDGGVHSHITHLFALLEMAVGAGIENLYVHAFLDGRDVPPQSALGYIRALERRLGELGTGRIATVAGRYYAMDRDGRWERTQAAFDSLVHGRGLEFNSAEAAVRAAYDRGETDEFVRPSVITGVAGGSRGRIRGSGGFPPGHSNGRIRAGDGVIFFNFRADRARQITRALTEHDFNAFPRGTSLEPLYYTGMTRYDETLEVPYAFPPLELRNTLGEYLSKQGLTQLRIAETEKYAHVTYFFNGGEEEPFPGEKRILIPSPRVATYDLQPEMSAYQVTDTLLAKLRGEPPDFIVLNYANPDMVGHTGVLLAAVRAVEVVDECLGKVLEAILDLGGAALVISDHGNVEVMRDQETGQPHTAHTPNPVPCILVDDRRRDARLRPGILGDVAPTLLEVIGLEKPEEMTGKSLIVPGVTGSR